MALRRKVALHAVGYTLVALALLAFASRVILKINAGQSLETYHSGKLVQWTYGGALVALVALIGAAVVAIAIRCVSSFRTSRELRRLAQSHGKQGTSRG